jgi:hypothetical protein
MSQAFDLEGGSFLPAASDVAGGPTVSDQKRCRPEEEEGETVSDQQNQKRARFGPTASGQKRCRREEEEGDVVDDKKRARTSLPPSFPRGEKRPRPDDNQEDHEEDNRSDGGRTSKTNTSADSDGDNMVICHAHAGGKQGGKLAVCAFCNKKADSPSPLSGSAPDDAHGGCVPWRSYQKYPHGLGDDPTPFKKPSGDACTICSQSYVASGMFAQHGKLSVYKKAVIDKNTAESTAIHKVFSEMRAIWIKEYNVEHKSNFPAFTASGKLARRLSTTGTTKMKSRYVEVRQQTKTTIAGRERAFVEKEHWDEKLDGTYDASKETTEVLLGKVRRGCWKWIGRPGVWKGSTEEATMIDDVHVEESGGGGLVENAANVKAKTLKDALFGAEATRDTHSVEAPILGFDDLMEMAGFKAAAPLFGTTSPRKVDGGAERDAAADVEEEVPEQKWRGLRRCPR